MTRHPLGSVDELLAWLESLEGFVGEDRVPLVPHLLQTAEVLWASQAEPELVAAGLVHDLGSALAVPDAEHGVVGARLVGPLLGGRVAALVEGHIDAKRYLVATEPAYGTGLSADSTRTLALQGGAMAPGEAVSFRERPDFEALLTLRRADDTAKVPGRRVPPVGHWEAVLAQVALLARSYQP